LLNRRLWTVQLEAAALKRVGPHSLWCYLAHMGGRRPRRVGTFLSGYNCHIHEDTSSLRIYRHGNLKSYKYNQNEQSIFIIIHLNTDTNSLTGSGVLYRDTDIIMVWHSDGRSVHWTLPSIFSTDKLASSYTEWWQQFELVHLCNNEKECFKICKCTHKKLMVWNKCMCDSMLEWKNQGGWEGAGAGGGGGNTHTHTHTLRYLVGKPEGKKRAWKTYEYVGEK
jgi:hypothetical protein